jgi:hypothetical protein
MKIRILSSALGDLKNGGKFYEEQGQGLGQYFQDSLFSDIDCLALYGGIQAIKRGYHRMLSKRFPYAIYYRMNGQVAEVWRVLDCRQHPDKIRRALEKT